MILTNGSKVLVTHRRLFREDSGRYFVGVVDGYEFGIARVSGFTWTRDQIGGDYNRKEELRTKIISLSSGMVICYQLPDSIDPAQVKFRSESGHSWLVFKSEFKMDLSESDYPRLGHHTGS